MSSLEEAIMGIGADKSDSATDRSSEKNDTSGGDFESSLSDARNDSDRSDDSNNGASGSDSASGGLGEMSSHNDQTGTKSSDKNSLDKTGAKSASISDGLIASGGGDQFDAFAAVIDDEYQPNAVLGVQPGDANVSPSLRGNVVLAEATVDQPTQLDVAPDGDISEELTAEDIAAINDFMEAYSRSNKIGYGDFPGDVSFMDLDDLSEEDAAAKIGAHLDSYGPENEFGLEDALDLAVAYTAQGGTVDFGLIEQHPNLDVHDQAYVRVTEQHATAMAAASNTISVLNENGENFGAEIYESLRAIDVASSQPSLSPEQRFGLDPDVPFGVPPEQPTATPAGVVAYEIIKDYTRMLSTPAFVDSQKLSAMRETFRAAGYGPDIGTVSADIAKEDQFARAERRRELQAMTPYERMQAVLGDALEIGAPLIGGTIIGANGPLGSGSARGQRMNLRTLGLEGVRLRGKSYAGGRKALENAGFTLIERVRDGGGRTFELTRGGLTVRVHYDRATRSNKAHWHIEVNGQPYRIDHRGRPVPSDSGPAHIKGK